MSTARCFSGLQKIICGKKDEEELPLSEPEEVSRSCNLNPWVYLQFAYNILNITTRTGYTTAKLVTDAFGLEVFYLGLSTWGIGAGLPIGFVFALAEALSHQAQSEHFNHAEDNTSTTVVVDAEAAALTWQQKILVGMHYISDVSEGVATPLMVAGLMGIDTAPPEVRWGSYAAFTLYSAAGNVQEFKNAIVAFREKNAREAASPASDRSIRLN